MIPCKHCGNLFEPTRAHNVYCSVLCRKKVDNHKRFGGSGTNSNYYRALFIEERGGLCEVCDSKDDLEVCHLVPVAVGGTHEVANVVVLCKDCHAELDAPSRDS